VRPDRLTLLELNRATLARQHLLERSDMTPVAMVEHLVGLQAQVPLDPYAGLWSRIEGFRPESLADLLLRRAVVRIVVMRGTIHLLTADDCLLLRPLMQPVLDAELARHRDFGRPLREIDLAPALAFAASALAERPLTGPELRATLAERYGDDAAPALAYACRCLLPVVQVPPRGVWGQTSQVTLATVDAWLRRPLADRPSLDDVVLRYFGAFGPATVADVTSWCRLTGMRDVVERLRPTLRAFRDEDGRELFDLPDAPRPGADVPAPIRFLPEYDNVLLSHADRTRIVPERRRDALRRVGGVGFGSVLRDGLVCGVWRVRWDRANGAATLEVSLAERPAQRAVASIAAEGRRFLRFAAADATTAEVEVGVADG
jgi:hypothetical protein